MLPVEDLRPGRPPGWPAWSAVTPAEAAKDREELQSALSRGAGVLRRAAALEATLRAVERAVPPPGGDPDLPRGTGVAALESANLRTVARALLVGALARRESRGCHRRDDFPEPVDALRRRFVQ